MRISKSTFDFLREVDLNNNKTWFNLNSEWYQESYDEFTTFVYELADHISKFDKRVKESLNNPKTIRIFRFNRDIRFSKDKSPYKRNFGASIVPNGLRNVNSGYYLHIQPKESFVGGGLYMPDQHTLSLVRKYIEENDKGLRRILSSIQYLEHFNGLSDLDMLKTTPRGYAKDHPSADFLKLKSYTAVKHFSDSKVISNVFDEDSLQVFRAIYPLNDYLTKALQQ